MISSPGKTVAVSRQDIKIYELNKSQFDLLSISTNGGNIVFAIIEPNEDDPPDKRKKLNDEMQQMKDLINIGLVEDVTHKFKDTIQVAKINNNRDVKVVAVTTLGVKLFRNHGNRTIN